MPAIRFVLPQLPVLLLACLGLQACLGPAERDPAAIARTYVEARRFAEAAREIEIAVRQQPDDTELRMTAAEIHAAAEQLQQAIEHLEAVHSRQPSHLAATILLGELEQRRGNPADAYVAFRRAARQDPENVRAVSGLALSAEALGFEAEANEAYERWEALEDPDWAGR